jgi:hypothetical protein
MSLSTCENISLHMLVFQQRPCVVFPFHFSLLEWVFLAMVTKTMELHVLPHLSFAIIMSVIFFIFGCPKVTLTHLF